MHLAYSFVILSILQAEAAFQAERLELDVRVPIESRDLSNSFIVSPDDMSIMFRGAGGTLDVHSSKPNEESGFSFSFTRGHRYIQKVHPFGSMQTAERNSALAGHTSLIDTNGAYRLAIKWLNAIQVDVHAIESKKQHCVEQEWFYAPEGKKQLPLFHVIWGKPDKPTIDVYIDGRSNEMIYIRQEDDSFSRRPEELVKNVDKLIAVRDEEFKKLSESECRNLVVQYSVVDYSHPEAAEVGIAHRYDITNDYQKIWESSAVYKEFLRLETLEKDKIGTNSQK